MEIEPLKILSTDTKQTARLGQGTLVEITAQQHARLHFAVRDAQLKINELVAAVNSLEIPDD